jgi:LPS export ABC transporter protein LptC
VNLRFLLAIGTGIVLAGCASGPRATVRPQPFAFRALDLRQQDGQGQPAWDLTSPEARYDIHRKFAQALRPEGVIYRGGKPNIVISARRGTVIGDGQAVQLEGDVRIKLLGKDPVEISGDTVRWLPREDLMVIDQRPAALDRRSRITAQTATYFIKRDLVELRGAPVLEHWQEGRKADGRQNSLPMKVKTEWVDWRPEQGDLTAPAVVKGERFDPDLKGPAAAAAKPVMVLTAQGLKGNLRAGFVDLLAPVLVRSSDRKGFLSAQRTRWAINAQRLSSDQPFNGQFNALKAQGSAFQIDLEKSDVLIPNNCLLVQPGEELTAQRCLWNWPSGRFEARDQVVLRRQTYKQITRAQRLDGQIGNDGVAVFSSPGSRVNSRFTLPKSQQGGKRRQPTPVAF